MAGDKKPRTTAHFRLKIGGRDSAGMFREVTGLDSESEVVEQKDIDANGKPTLVKVSGLAKWSNIELKRGLDTNNALWEWRKSVEDKGPDEARTDCILEAIDYDSSVIATYNIKQAWPSKYTGAAMNAGANEIAVEAVTLAHEGFERK